MSEISEMGLDATEAQGLIAAEILVIIPAFNEAETISQVVRGVRKEFGANVVVVDDGSSDSTADRARASGATVLSLPFNLGVGGAVRTGLNYAERSGIEYILQLDADGQHSPAEGRRLIDALQEKNADVVVGSRFQSGYKVSFMRRAAMKALSALVSRKLRTKVTDTTSGFRAMNRRAIEYLASRYPSEYLSDTVVTLLLAGEGGLSVAEVDVEMSPRRGGSPSTPGVKGAYHLFRTLLVVFLHLVPSKNGGRSGRRRARAKR